MDGLSRLCGSPVTQVFSEKGSELDTPFVEGLVADLNAALVQQFLHVSVTQGKAVVEPNGLLDDGHGEAASVTAGQPTPTRLRQHNRVFLW
jgi:hypothetical protein